MSEKIKSDLTAIIRQFQIAGELVSAEIYGSGHINDTYRVSFNHGGTRVRYILQRINCDIFKQPVALMGNIQRVTAHLAAKVAAEPDCHRRVLTLVPSCDGAPFFCDANGHYWRVYFFVEGARSYDAVENPAQAEAAAKAFGQFAKLLADLPSPRLHDTIPDFHHTPKRFAALEKAIAKDAFKRAKLAKPEIEFALRHQAICHVLLDANLPERVTHNDTKLNNVLLDDATGEGICVLDLDTVMPGLALYDFGDLVRSATCSAPEDELDLSQVRMEFPMFAALARGYLSSVADFLTPAEKKFLPFAGKLIAFETGLRFLTDFLAGDTYFKVQRVGQNLDRCRRQFKLVESISEQEAAMRQLVEKL